MLNSERSAILKDTGRGVSSRQELTKDLRFHDDGPGWAYILKNIPVRHESGPAPGCRAVAYVGP